MTQSEVVVTESLSAVDLVAGGTSTSFELSPGEAVTGFVSSLGDEDWYRVDLIAGQTYTFGLNGFGQEALRDPLVRLYNGAGTQVAENDDQGPLLGSLLTFTPTTSGNYYIAADAFANGYTGEYLLTMNSGKTPFLPDISIGEIADYLTHSFWLVVGTTPRQWGTATVTYNVQGLSPERADLARLAFATWDDLADLSFVETSGTAQITVDDRQNGAFTTFTLDDSTTITSANINVAADWYFGDSTIDSYTFQTFIHEIGHAIGLGHAGPYNGSGTFGIDNVYGNDSWQMSAMSYFSQAEAGSGSYRFVMTPMIADILAMQELYGAAAARPANTVYGFGSTAGDLYDFGFYSTAPALTIYDSGGTDWLVASGYSAGQLIDLRSGRLSDIGGLIGNIAISLTTVIENAEGGSGNDTMFGNSAGNRLVGGAGNDLMRGGSGNDVLAGGGGNDRLFGGSENDFLYGGDGDDRLVDGAGDNRLYGGAGADVLSGGDGNDHLVGQTGEDRLHGGDGADVLGGGGGEDRLFGGAGDDRLVGGIDDDRLSGEAGADVLFGGAGHDILSGGDGDDRLVGQGGADKLYGGNDNDVLGGGGGDDRLFGGAGEDQLQGGLGNDRLVGGAGDDWLSGDGGWDIFVFQPGGGYDIVADFQMDLDMLDFSAFGFLDAAAILALAAQTGDDVLFSLPDGESVELSSFSLALLGADDVIV